MISSIKYEAPSYSHNNEVFCCCTCFKQLPTTLMVINNIFLLVCITPCILRRVSTLSFITYYCFFISLKTNLKQKKNVNTLNFQIIFIERSGTFKMKRNNHYFLRVLAAFGLCIPQRWSIIIRYFFHLVVLTVHTWVVSNC